LRRYAASPMFILIILIGVMAFMTAMRNDPLGWIMSKILILPGIIVGLSFHEFAHAYAAVKLGDNTPRFQGRVTINPKAHFDVFGFACLLFAGFGWGVPVQIDPRNFKHRRRDEFIVSIAGVTMNFILAIVFAGILKLLFTVAPAFMMGTLGSVIIDVFMGVITINIILMLFNLLPIPPLDGFNIVAEIFNLKRTRLYWQIYQHGFLILMACILLDITDKILNPLFAMVYSFIMGIFF